MSFFLDIHNQGDSLEAASTVQFKREVMFIWELNEGQVSWVTEKRKMVSAEATEVGKHHTTSNIKSHVKSFIIRTLKSHWKADRLDMIPLVTG